uniref:Putative 18 3 19 kDa secreted protein n=1 Tax=Ixodes ricinus TaxID=34613 RepID=V5ICG4_IXORI
MLPSVHFFGVFQSLALSGEITCDVLPQPTKNCNDNDFHEPGYALGCTYHCTTGNQGESHIQTEAYNNATVCVEFKENDDTELDHVGVCFSGECLDQQKTMSGLYRTRPSNEMEPSS